MIKLNIDNKKIEVEEGKTVLEAALQSDIYIPNLCYHPDLHPLSICRLCIVEIDGMRGFSTACSIEAKDEMIVHTNTPQIQKYRKNIIWLILSELPKNMDKSSQLMKVVEYIGVNEILSGYTSKPKDLPILSDEPLFLRDINKCILCGRCVTICQEIRGVGTIGFINRSIKSKVGTSFDSNFKDADCKFCGACIQVCPSGALTDKEKYEEKDREKILLPCKNACPAGVDIPQYVRLIAEARFQDAIEVIREKVPFPNVLGLVCDHPCEEACRRNELNGSISIRQLKRFVAEQDSGRWITKINIAPDTGKKVAIIGSGPAGLSAAWFLRKSGHAVTVFEALPVIGGMMATGIPKYRLPRKVLNSEIKNIENIGVKIKTNTRIESLDQIFNQGFNAIFLALGAPEGSKMGFPGEDNTQVLDGISVLRAINLDEDIDITGDVAVIGGGNVAMDVSRSALRKGANKVTILYRRTRTEMPADPEEVKEAIKEGIQINFLVNPQRVSHKNNRLAVECIRMKLGEPDASGRRRPVPIKDSEFIVETDKLIVAIGQNIVIPKQFNVSVNKRGELIVNPDTLSCSRQGVFAGGDVVSGPATVIKAIQSGRQAAISIDKYLEKNGEIDQKYIPNEIESDYIGMHLGFAYKKRAEMQTLPVEQRLKDDNPQVDFCFDKETAMNEAKRCLKCQLRLNISNAPLPPK